MCLKLSVGLILLKVEERLTYLGKNEEKCHAASKCIKANICIVTPCISFGYKMAYEGSSALHSYLSYDLTSFQFSDKTLCQGTL